MSDPLPSPGPAIELPAGLPAALARGACGRCPRCGEGALFRKWLKPHDACGVCGLDISGQRADDFPAYIALLVVGHLLAPVFIFLAAETALSVAGVLAITLPLATAMLLAMLQPAKGGVIALQWWNGMHGFRRERRSDGAPARGEGPE